MVVLTDASLEESQRINEVCHSHQPPIPFIRVETRGVFASVFCDFGPSFTVYDVDGAQGGGYAADAWMQVLALSLAVLQQCASCTAGCSVARRMQLHALVPVTRSQHGICKALGCTRGWQHSLLAGSALMRAVLCCCPGEEPHSGIVASISSDNPALVTCVDDERLEFQVIAQGLGEVCVFLRVCILVCAYLRPHCFMTQQQCSFDHMHK